MTRIGSLFAGIGGLDLAVEAWSGGRTTWQLDLVGAEVRRRHWPDAMQIAADVRTVDPADLPPVDVLAGGFPCQDLSVAGNQAGLDGARSGLYRELLRIARGLAPDVIVIENVPALLSRHRARLEDDLAAEGYGATWCRARALDAGAPHLRRRVFVVALRGEDHGGVVDAPRGGEWRGDDARLWATPLANDARGNGSSPKWRPLNQQVRLLERPWPTPTAGDSRGSGARNAPGSRAHPGMSLTDATSRRHLERPWPTPTASRPNESETLTSFDARCARVAKYSRPVSDPLGIAARRPTERPWPTPTATDYKSATRVGQRRGQLSGEVPNEAFGAPSGDLLHPRWVEALMGLPVGWASSEGTGLADLAAEGLGAPRWPRGRYPRGWTGDWPGYEWEPARTCPRYPGRAGELRALGNAVVPQQALLALRAIDAPAQGVMPFALAEHRSSAWPAPR